MMSMKLVQVKIQRRAHLDGSYIVDIAGRVVGSTWHNRLNGHCVPCYSGKYTRENIDLALTVG